MPALVKTLAFNEARLRMIAENVANAHTPGYHAKQLDVMGFQQALGEALEVHRGDPSRSLIVERGREVTTDAKGSLRVTPSEKPADNVLFHDGTNVSIEREMADLAQTGMTHELAAALLRDRMNSLQKAIRGTV
jgi:flagellar basal-body rod protein FlgB